MTKWMRRATIVTSGLVAAGWMFSGQAHANLTIVPTFDSSITSDPNAAIIESTINQAIAIYSEDFTTDITVPITYEEMSGGLGESETEVADVPYAEFLQGLENTASSADDATALSNLPVQTDNPVNGSAEIQGTIADLAAVGFNTSGIPGPWSTIGLNTSIMNLSRPDSNANKYDLMAVVMHETDEALGTGSTLNEVQQGDISAGGPVAPEDLFRYASNGTRSYTTSGSATSFFSLNGTTDLAQFNQNSGGDYGDWQSLTGHFAPQVQDAFGTPGAMPNLGVESRVLDVIGYTRSAQSFAAPEPSSVALIAAAAGAFFPVVLPIARRRRNQSTAAAA